MGKMSNKHTLTFDKDPLKDTRKTMGTLKSFKGASFPDNPYKDSSPDTEIDEFYTPHKGGERK